MNELKKQLIEHMFNLKAIKLKPEDPFCWKSGYYMPVYNDNRLLTGSPEAWEVAIKNLESQLEIKDFDYIAGVATAGISHGAVLAYRLKIPFIYTRDKPKDHGMGHTIEGVSSSEELKGKKVVVVEDLISTGGSSRSTVETIREAGGIVDLCISIFNYSLPDEYNKFVEMDSPCKVSSALTFPELIQYVEENKMFSDEQIASLKYWYKDPFGWGERHGFPPKK